MRVKFRWLLPIAHALIDCVLLVSLIRHADHLLRHKAANQRPSANVQPALLQEGGSVEWIPMYDSPPGPFLVLMSGDLPAGLLSGILRPGAYVVNRVQRWDPIWFFMHEAFSFACWYLIGRWADTGRLQLGWVMIGYVVARLLVALTGLYDVGWRAEVLFWLCFALWVLGLGLSRAVRVGLRLARGEMCTWTT
jgi:hypothetical protein